MRRIESAMTRAMERITALERLLVIDTYFHRWNTHIPPSMNKAMRPVLVFSPMRRLRMKGTGSDKITMSRNMLLEACAIQVAKNSLAFLDPQPTQRPGRVKSQFLATGVQESRANRPKVSPHRLTKMSMPQAALRATSERPSKRRRYCARTAILMNVVLRQ